MKSTGIVRQIDDLGRVVIPKELRRTMRIREGESLEIFTEGDRIIYRKYSPLVNLQDEAEKHLKSLYKRIGRTIAICNLDEIILTVGKEAKAVHNRKIGQDILDILRKGRTGRTEGTAVLDDVFTISLLVPILDNHNIKNLYGGILVFADGKKDVTAIDIELTSYVAEMIANELSEN